MSNSRASGKMPSSPAWALALAVRTTRGWERAKALHAEAGLATFQELGLLAGDVMQLGMEYMQLATQGRALTCSCLQLFEHSARKHPQVLLGLAATDGARMLTLLANVLTLRATLLANIGLCSHSSRNDIGSPTAGWPGTLTRPQSASEQTSGMDAYLHTPIGLAVEFPKCGVQRPNIPRRAA